MDHTIAGVETSIAAFVGFTPTGPQNQPQRIASFVDYIRIFGPLTTLSEVGYSVEHFFENGGTAAYVVRTLTWATADLIGDPALSTGLFALAQVDIFNLLCLPDAARATAGDPGTLDATVDPTAIYSAALAFCEQRRAFLLVDPPPEVNNVPTASAWISTGLGVNGPNGAAFFPRLIAPDAAIGGAQREFAPSGIVAGIYATSDSERGVWKAPAGLQVPLKGVQALAHLLDDAGNSELNSLGLNCFRSFPGKPLLLWGARTLAGADAEASEWKFVSVRRTALFVAESISRGTQWITFEVNGEPLWAQVRLNVEAFLHQLFRQGAFQGLTPAQAFFVRCGPDTMTPEEVSAGIVNIEIGFAPLRPAEFLILRLQQTAQA